MVRGREGERANRGGRERMEEKEEPGYSTMKTAADPIGYAPLRPSVHLALAQSHL